MSHYKTLYISKNYFLQDLFWENNIWQRAKPIKTRLKNIVPQDDKALSRLTGRKSVELLLTCFFFSFKNRQVDIQLVLPYKKLYVENCAKCKVNTSTKNIWSSRDSSRKESIENS